MLFRSQTTTAGQAPEFLVVGLGNPGSQYENTRHNAGFIAMDIMAEKLGFDIKRLKFKGSSAILLSMATGWPSSSPPPI